MKHFISLLVFCTIGVHLFAQADDIHVSNKWCAKKDTPLLFIAGNNLVQVYGHGIKPSEIKLKSLDKSLRIGRPQIKGDTLSVLAMPFPEKGKTMRLAVQSSKNSKTLKVVNFTCDSIPQLVATIGTIKGSEAKKKDILSQMTLKIAFPNSLYSYPYSIKQYTFKISTPKGGATIPVRGFFLTNEIIKEIGDAPEGTVFDIYNIIATCPECSTRTLPPIKMKIK
jgi:hypothetical protein